MNERVAKLNEMRRKREEEKRERRKKRINKRVATELKRRIRYIKRERSTVKSELREAKKKERERIKKQVAANKKMRAKVRAEKEKALRESGNRRGKFKMVIMKNFSLYKNLGKSKLFTDANVMFDDYVRENRVSVNFPLKYSRTSNAVSKKQIKYEILLLEDMEGHDVKPYHYKNENGKFVELTINSKKGNYRILRREDWLVEDTFAVDGYNPIKDRKDCNFIVNEILEKDSSSDNIKFVYYRINKIFVIHNDNCDVITAKSKDECRRLFDALSNLVNNDGNIVFVGACDKEFNKWVSENSSEKTGRLKKSFIST